MLAFTSTNNDALGKLLAGLVPNVALSGVGAALLAAQIRDFQREAVTPAPQPRGKVRRRHLPTEA